jgi:hypothetical protein
MWRWSGHSKHSFIRIIQSCSSTVVRLIRIFHVSCATHFVRVLWLEFSLQSYVIELPRSASNFNHSAHGDQSWLFQVQAIGASHLYVRHYRSVYQTGFILQQCIQLQTLHVNFLLFTTTYLSLSGALTMCSVITPCWRELCGA